MGRLAPHLVDQNGLTLSQGMNHDCSGPFSCMPEGTPSYQSRLTLFEGEWPKDHDFVPGGTHQNRDEEGACQSDDLHHVPGWVD